MSASGIVLRARSGFYTVLTDDGRRVEAQVRGRLKQERRSSDIAVIGDRVAVQLLDDGTGVIESVEPRARRLGRRQPGPRGTWREDVMVANPDLAVLVFSVAEPPPNPRLIDRFLVVAEDSDVPVLLVANKVDLDADGRAAEVFEPYRRIGYDVLRTSTHSGEGLPALREALAGRLSILTGPSGVGKSTLLNAMQPGLRLATAEISQALHKGRHTTTLAELHALDGSGGFVADTPGIRELGLWQVPAADLAMAFPEFRPYLGECGFNDCSHVHEPRCAVLAAVDGGAVSAARHDSYRRMLAGER